MKNGLFLLFFVVTSWQVHGRQQVVESDSLTVDSLELAEPRLPRKVGFWIAGYVEPAYVVEADGPNFGVGAVVVWKEQIYAGLYGNVFNGEYHRRLIFPNEFRMQYSHAGIWLGYKTRLDKRYQITADVRMGEGKVFWERLDDFYNMFEDYALFVQPSLGVDFKLLSFVALHAELGYRRVGGLDIPETSNRDFSGVTGNIMLKVGLF